MCLAGCTNIDSLNNRYMTGVIEGKETGRQSENFVYYPFLMETDSGLKFSITVDEFLNNYSMLKSSYNGENDKMLSFADFSYVDKGIDYNGNNIVVYGTTENIIGRKNDVCIMISIDDEGNMTAIKIVVHNLEEFTKNERSKLLIQYRLLIQALGITEEEAKMYLDRMQNNYDRCNLFVAYAGGAALSHDRDNSGSDYFRISPYTIRQWEATYGL